MAQGQPLTDKQRNAIARDIAAGKKRNEIAREHGVSPSTVSKIAREENATFDRTMTETATRAKQADNRSRRAQISSDLLDDVQRLRERAWSPYAYYVASKDGAQRVELDLPPLSEVRNAYASIGIALDKHGVLERADADSGAAGAVSMLSGIAEALEKVAEVLDAEPPDEG